MVHIISFHFISFQIFLINQQDWITGYAYTNPLQQQDGTIGKQFAQVIEQSTHHVYIQFILITKHKHMYINSRIIQTKQKSLSFFFPFFSFFVNRYDIIRILIAESYRNLSLVTTCLMWHYFNVSLEGHIRQVFLYFADTFYSSTE